MPFWDDPRIEPKRSYRFLVPFRVFLPKTATPSSPTQISDWAKSGHDLVDINTSKYGSNNVFWFLAQSVTKPGATTNIGRTEHVTNGYSLQRRRQPLVWSFDPISLQLIDTYDHDIEMSVTAMIYAMGGIAPATREPNVAQFNFAGSMVPIDNGTPGEFAIYELLEGTYGANGKVSSVGGLNLRTRDSAVDQASTSTWARKLILKNPYLTSADFGSLDYSSEAFSSVSLQISYDTYDIKQFVDRHNFDPSQFSERSLGELRSNQRAQRRLSREGGANSAEMSLIRTDQRLDRQQFRNEEGVIPGWTNH
jgi:hypothetical protein